MPDRQDHMATYSVAGGNSCIYFDSVLYRFRFVIRWLCSPTEPFLLQWNYTNASNSCILRLVVWPRADRVLTCPFLNGMARCLLKQYVDTYFGFRLSVFWSCMGKQDSWKHAKLVGKTRRWGNSTVGQKGG